MHSPNGFVKKPDTLPSEMLGSIGVAMWLMAFVASIIGTPALAVDGVLKWFRLPSWITVPIAIYASLRGWKAFFDTDGFGFLDRWFGVQPSPAWDGTKRSIGQVMATHGSYPRLYPPRG